MATTPAVTCVGVAFASIVDGEEEEEEEKVVDDDDDDTVDAVTAVADTEGTEGTVEGIVDTEEDKVGTVEGTRVLSLSRSTAHSLAPPLSCAARNMLWVGG